MSASRLVLKQKTGWFAAGRELQDALRLLSDSAFKLYVWLCLNADRRVGTIRMESARLASSLLGVESRWLDAGLAELRLRGVCRNEGEQIEIEDRFWPYEKQPQSQRRELSVQDSHTLLNLWSEVVDSLLPNGARGTAWQLGSGAARRGMVKN